MTDTPARLWARELSARGEALRAVLHDLHQRADIVDQVERLSLPSSMPWDIEAPFGTDEWRRERELEDRWEYERFVRGLRRLYSTIPDPGLRRELIEASRQLDAVHQADAYAWVAEAAADLVRARRSPRWWLTASSVGLGLVYLGHYSAGSSGILWGVLAALVLTVGIRTNALADWRARVGAAEVALKLAEELAQRRGERGYVFSAAEAETGELVSRARASA